MGFAGHLGQIKEFHCRQMSMRQRKRGKKDRPMGCTYLKWERSMRHSSREVWVPGRPSGLQALASSRVVLLL